MSFWKYLIKTSLKQKKSDWAEFQDMQQQAEDAHNAMLAARGRISYACNSEKYSYPEACINHITVRGRKIKVVREECPFFCGLDNLNGCLILPCEYAEKNKQYHNACDKADELHQAVDKFWANKFAHIK